MAVQEVRRIVANSIGHASVEGRDLVRVVNSTGHASVGGNDAVRTAEKPCSSSSSSTPHDLIPRGTVRSMIDNIMQGMHGAGCGRGTDDTEIKSERAKIVIKLRGKQFLIDISPSRFLLHPVLTPLFKVKEGQGHEVKKKSCLVYTSWRRGFSKCTVSLFV